MRNDHNCVTHRIIVVVGPSWMFNFSSPPSLSWELSAFQRSLFVRFVVHDVIHKPIQIRWRNHEAVKWKTKNSKLARNLKPQKTQNFIIRFFFFGGVWCVMTRVSGENNSAKPASVAARWLAFLSPHTDKIAEAAALVAKAGESSEVETATLNIRRNTHGQHKTRSIAFVYTKMKIYSESEVTPFHFSHVTASTLKLIFFIFI